VIPTMILLGIVFGRWWPGSIPVLSVGWGALMIVDGNGSGFAFFIDAAMLAMANVLIGVLVFQVFRFGARAVARWW
jgi:hypothetical protein